MIDLHENEEVLTAQLIYIKPIDYMEYEDKIKDFYQYIFKEILHGINKGFSSSFKLLPCILKGEFIHY